MSKTVTLSITVEAIMSEGGKTFVNIKTPKKQKELTTKTMAHVLTSAVALLIKSCNKPNSEMKDYELMEEVYDHLKTSFITDDYEDAQRIKLPNYTRPDDENYEDSPQDWLNGSLLFSRALGLMLAETEGIIVDIVGDVDFGVDEYGNDIKRVVVWNGDEQIHVLPYDDDDVPEGTLTWMHEEEDNEDE